MSKEKINKLIKELVILCKKNGISGKHTSIVLEDMEYYISFDFRKIGMPIGSILKKPLKDRTHEEHKKVIEDKFYGNFEEYFKEFRLTEGERT